MERYFPKERHHTLWEKRQYTAPIERRVRNMASFIIDVTRPHHRLLHASLVPPNKPEVEALREMEHLAIGGLEVVMNRLEHPIVQHLQSQLEIVSMPVEEAIDRLDTGDYWRGYGSRRPLPKEEDVIKIVNIVQHRVAEELGRLPYKMNLEAYEDAAFYQLEEFVGRGLITRDEAHHALIAYKNIYCRS